MRVDGVALADWQTDKQDRQRTNVERLNGSSTPGQELHRWIVRRQSDVGGRTLADGADGVGERWTVAADGGCGCCVCKWSAVGDRWPGPPLPDPDDLELPDRHCREPDTSGKTQAISEQPGLKKGRTRWMGLPVDTARKRLALSSLHSIPCSVTTQQEINTCRNRERGKN